MNERKELLICAVHRAGKPSTSGDVTDAAYGLAIAEQWPPEHREEIVRKRVSKILENMVVTGQLMYAGDVEEKGTSRLVPTYAPPHGYDKDYPLPDRPAAARANGKRAPHVDKSKQELIAMLDAQDALLECFSRFMADFTTTREKVRRKLAEMDLEPGR